MENIENIVENAESIVGDIVLTDEEKNLQLAEERKEKSKDIAKFLASEGCKEIIKMHETKAEVFMGKIKKELANRLKGKRAVIEYTDIDSRLFLIPLIEFTIKELKKTNDPGARHIADKINATRLERFIAETESFVVSENIITGASSLLDIPSYSELDMLKLQWNYLFTIEKYFEGVHKMFSVTPREIETENHPY